MSVRHIFYFFIFIYIFALSLHSQIQTEYTYVFEKEKNITVSDFDSSDRLSEDSLQMTISRRDMPLVNRLVRFVSTTPDVFEFEDGQTSLIATTDENGTVQAPINIKGPGRGIAVLHLLYVGANVAITNITHEEYVTLNIDVEGKSAVQYIDDLSFETDDINSVYYLFPTYLFLCVILFFVIGYFKRLKIGKEYNYIEMYMIATLLGFSSVKEKSKNFLLIIIFFTIEIMLFYLIIIVTNPIVPTLLFLFALVGVTAPKDRSYAVFFTLFAMMSIVYYISLLQVPFVSYLFTSENLFFVNKWYFLLPFFFILTAFLSNAYIPLIALSSMQIFFDLSMINVHFAILGIVLAFTLFIFKTIFSIKIPFFYKLNILKVDVL